MDNSSFLPDDYMQKRSQRRINAIFFMVFIFVAAVVAVCIFMTEHRQRELDQRKAQQDQEITQVQQSLETLQQIEDRRSEILAKARLSAALIEPIPQSLIMALITNRLPQDVSLSYYKIDTREIPRPQSQSAEGESRRSRRRRNQDQEEEEQPILPPEYRTTIEIQGLARTDLLVAGFVENLDNTTLLERVTLHYSREDEQSDGTVLREFKVTARISPGRKATDAHVEEARYALADEDESSSVLGWIFGNK